MCRKPGAKDARRCDVVWLLQPPVQLLLLAHLTDEELKMTQLLFMFT